MFRFLFWILAFAILTCGLVTPALIAQAEPNSSEMIDRQLHELSDSIMSPYCPGMTLSGCPSPDARALREEVRGWLVQGDQPQVIKNKLVQRFGPDLTGLPESANAAEFALGIPWIMVIAGLTGVFILIWVGRKNRASRTAREETEVVSTESVTAPPLDIPPELAEQYYKEIDQEVSRRLTGRV